MKALIALSLAITLLAACTTSSPEATQQLPLTPVTAEQRDDYLQVFRISERSKPDVYVLLTSRRSDLERSTGRDSGEDYPFISRITVSQWYDPKNPISVQDPMPEVSDRIRAFSATDRDAINYVGAIARQTFCRGGSISENRTAGFSVRDPADLRRVINANAGVMLGARLPEGVEPQPVPTVERSFRNGVISYRVRLRCSLWRAP